MRLIRLLFGDLPRSRRTRCVTSGSPPDCRQVAVTGMSLVPKASCSARAALAPMRRHVAGIRRIRRRREQRQPASASGSVAGLRSVSACRIAVTGRHRPYTNLLVCAVCRPSCTDDVHEHEHPRRLDQRQPALARHVARDVVPDRQEVGGRAGAGRGDARPEPRDRRLVGRAGGAVRLADELAPRSDRSA